MAIDLKRLTPMALAVILTACGGSEAEQPKKKAGLDPAAAVEEASAAANAPGKPNAPGVPGKSPAGARAAVKVAEALPEPDQALVRENFSYTGATRDPFHSLLTDSHTGPELPDLTLVAVYYDTRNPNLSVAVLRERVTNKRYSVHVGDHLGRLRVSDIRPKDVAFTIDDFGTQRQESLSLRKQEVEN
ncbi:MAG: hypothetical protein ABI647_12770 [Gemmatimonadota bacterium]